MTCASVYIYGMREIDDEFGKMLAIRDSCFAAGVALPVEVVNYFGGVPDQDQKDLLAQKFGTRILALSDNGDVLDWATEIEMIEELPSGEMQRLYDIHLDKLPTKLKTLRIEMTGW